MGDKKMEVECRMAESLLSVVGRALSKEGQRLRSAVERRKRFNFRINAPEGAQCGVRMLRTCVGLCGA